MLKVESTTVSSIDSSKAWTWRVAKGLAEVDSLASEWNALAHAQNRSGSADAVWTAAAWQAFGSTHQELYIHSLRDHEDQLLAVVPLVRPSRRVSAWESLPDVRHVPSWDCAFDEDREGVASAMIRHLLESTSQLDLNRISISSYAFPALTDAAKTVDLPIWRDIIGQDAIIDLTDSWQNLRSGWSKNLVRNTERNIRQLEKKGRLTWQTLVSEDGLKEALDECFALEAQGWKGQRGTAMMNQSQTLRFYTDLAYGSARVGRLALYTLRLGDRLIAFEYALKGQRRIEALKSGYDPDMSKQSPSNVLRYLLLQEEVEKDQTDHYHMGLSSQWKERWANRMEDLLRLRIYRRDFGGMTAYWAGPRLRATVKQSRTLKHAVRWFRGLAEKPANH